jgi:hypothetical protein
MFHAAFGALIQRDPPLSPRPADGAFTLLRETTDPRHPCRLAFDTTIDGLPYSLSTRLVVTPHFSYNTNFTPQIRLSPTQWRDLQADEPACAAFLQGDPRVVVVPPAEQYDYAAFMVAPDDVGAVFSDLETQFPERISELRSGFYDAHAMMTGVLAALYASGELTYELFGGGSAGALNRTEGSCRFCVNDHWQFPGECRYGKTDETPPPVGFLEKVAAAFVAAGSPGEP